VGLNNAFGDMLLMFVTGTMFLVLPGSGWRALLGRDSGRQHPRLSRARDARLWRKGRCDHRSVEEVIAAGRPRRINAETVVGVQAGILLAFRHSGSGNSSPKSVLRAIQAATMTHTITRASQKVVYSSTPSAASNHPHERGGSSRRHALGNQPVRRPPFARA
jgi:hypothetical protein